VQHTIFWETKGTAKLEKLLKELNETSSLNDKVAILVKNDSVLVREALQIALDPKILTNIKKFDECPTGRYSVADVWIDFKKISGNLHSRAISGTQARTVVNDLLSKCTADAQRVIKLILGKDLKCGVGISLVEKAYGKIIGEFTVQLAEKYLDYHKKQKNDGIAYWWASKKLDGIRSYFNGTMYSRTGKKIIGFDHIAEELNILMTENDLTFVDGELYSHSIPFQTISSIVSKKKGFDPAVKKQLKYSVFYIGGDWANTDEMVKKYAECMTKYNFKYVTFIPYEQVANNREAIDALCVKYVEEGYEGVMLRNPVNHYDWKRSANLLKHKLFIEDDFKIVGFEEGTPGTACEGTLGATLLEGEYEGKKVRSKCGSGYKLSGEYSRDWFWTNRATILGQMAETKFQGLTDEADENGYFSLRFPIFRKLKEKL